MEARATLAADALSAALSYAACGWAVSIVERGGKAPIGRLMPHGHLSASKDPDAIASWFTECPNDSVAVATGEISGLFALDADAQAGGLATLAQLAEEHGPLPKTPTVHTGGGGLHLYFRWPAGVRVKNGSLAGLPGLEVKGNGSGVVAPPSVHKSGVRYAWNPELGPDIPLAEPPAWLLKAVKQDGQRRASPVGKCIPGGERNATLASLAGSMRDRGMSEGAICAALNVENEARCDPPLSERDVETIAKSIGRYAPAVAVEAGAASEPFTAENLSDVLDAKDEPLDAVIGDGADGAILTSDGKGFVAGPTGVGKTNAALRLSRNLAESSPFLGYPVPEPQRVLYLALEGSRRAFRRRLRKVWAGASADAIARFHLAHVTLNLAEESDLDRLDDLLYRVKPEVLIIDPLRNAHPWDENLSHEMARLTAILDGLINRHHCALVLCHHDRKRPPFTRHDSGTDRVRGSTALTGWLTFCLSIDREPGNAKDRLVLVWTKTRDAEEALDPLVVDFCRDTLDFAIVEGAAVGGKVSDDAILTAVFQSGGAIRGTDLINGFVQGAGVSDRWTRKRVRELVKAGRLVEYIAPADAKAGAKSYQLTEEEPLEMDL